MGRQHHCLGFTEATKRLFVTWKEIWGSRYEGESGKMAAKQVTSVYRDIGRDGCKAP